MLFLYSKYYFTRRPIYILSAILACFFWFITRFEALPALFLLMAFILIRILIRCRRRRSHYAALLVSALVFVFGAGAWSWQRSVFLSQPELFGSLTNFSGELLYWHVSQSLTVSADNGPYSRELAAFIQDLPTHPADEPQDYYFDPEWKRNIFAQVDWGRFWALQKALQHRLGIKAADQLLRHVVVETVTAHPALLWDFYLPTFLCYFGLKPVQDRCYTFYREMAQFMPAFGEFAREARQWPFLFSWDEYELMPYNVNNIAMWTLKGNEKMIRSYNAGSLPLNPPHLKQMQVSLQLVRNVVRGAAGVLFWLLIWLLPFSRHRMLFLFIAAMAVMQAGAMAVAVEWYPRYEHTVLPEIIMTVACGLAALREVWVKASRGKARANSTGRLAQPDEEDRV